MTVATFAAKAPKYMHKLMADFGFSVEDAAAVMGNAGHESGGLSILQEIKPVVKGSRGGYGWFQWTGPRRKAYEAYCKRNGLNPAADDSNYAFLVVELRGSEKKAVAATKFAKGLESKVIAFEKSFERAGVKHYASRLTWAKRALDAFNKGGVKVTEPDKPKPEPKPVTPSQGAGAVAVGAGVAGASTLVGFDWGMAVVAGVVIAVIALAIWKVVRD